MSFQTMYQELLGAISGNNLGLTKTKINEALALVQDEQVWSFQCQVGGWLTPGLLGGSYSGQGQNQSFNAGATFVSPGTITVTPFTNTITGDAVATAAWNSVTSPPLLTQQQIRVPYYSLYNIIAQGNNGTVAYATILTQGAHQTPGTYTVPVLDPAGGTGATLSITVGSNGTVTLPPTVLTVGSGYSTPYVNFSEGGTAATFAVFLTGVLTIDRPWMEPPQVNGSYMIYMCYFASPPNWKRWWNIRDTTNNVDIDYWSMNQIDLSVEDAERTNFDEPTNIAYYGIDQRPGSATLGQQLWEMWPHPLSSLPYTFGCQCNWPPLVNPTDTVPYPLTDELVKWRAYEVLYQWREAQKGDEMERGSGANWQFLSGAAREEYKNRLRTIRNMDRHIVDLYFTRMQRNPAPGFQDGYATQTGQVNLGVF